VIGNDVDGGVRAATVTRRCGDAGKERARRSGAEAQEMGTHDRERLGDAQAARAGSGKAEAWKSRRPRRQADVVVN
jgi:hypothetical protein